MQKTYIITGASSDVGISLLNRLYSDDDIFILQGSGDLQPLESFSSGRSNIKIYDVDLSSPDSTDSFAAEIGEIPSPTHFVHLPALRVINTKFKNFDTDRFELDLNVQLKSAVKLSRVILPKMAKAKYGRVLFMLTNYILDMPPKNTAAYVMVKSALAGLVKSLAADYASFGVTVNGIAPSMMETKFLADTSPLIVEAAAASHPMKRNATPEDVTPAMKFLLSDEAAFITGVTLPVTGGLNI